MGIIKDCPRSAMEKCTDKYGCRGACHAVEQFEKEWREESKIESLLNSVHCSCGASWTYKDGALDYKPSTKKKEWVGLTDDEAADFVLFHAVVDEECIRAIEAKLKEKNV